MQCSSITAYYAHGTLKGLNVQSQYLRRVICSSAKPVGKPNVPKRPKHRYESRRNPTGGSVESSWGADLPSHNHRKRENHGGHNSAH